MYYTWDIHTVYYTLDLCHTAMYYRTCTSLWALCSPMKVSLACLPPAVMKVREHCVHVMYLAVHALCLIPLHVYALCGGVCACKMWTMKTYCPQQYVFTMSTTICLQWRVKPGQTCLHMPLPDAAGVQALRPSNVTRTNVNM